MRSRLRDAAELMKEAEHHVLVYVVCDENWRLKQHSTDEID